MPFNTARGKVHDGGQGGSWKAGLEAVSWSERHKQMGKGREKLGKKYHTKVWGAGCPREQQQRDGQLQENSTGAWTMNSRWAGGFLWKTSQWWWTSVFIASLASTWGQSPKASNAPAAFRQTASETESVAPGRNSWVLPVLFRLLSPAVGTCLISEKGVKMIVGFWGFYNLEGL